MKHFPVTGPTCTNPEVESPSKLEDLGLGWVFREFYATCTRNMPIDL